MTKTDTKSIVSKWYYWLIAAMLVCFVGFTAYGCSDDSNENNDNVIAEEEAAENDESNANDLDDEEVVEEEVIVENANEND
ncbi:MAG: hypothetical protein LUB61_06985 [Eggerthellaceae bacterium]|nr:hypothetical protein [Eggerthellaceae bacterium]